MRFVPSLLLCLLSFATIAKADPLLVNVEVTTRNSAWQKPFETCIKNRIMRWALTPPEIEVSFTQYSKSGVDVYLVTKPSKLTGGEQVGIDAAIVVDIRTSTQAPFVSVVGGGDDRQGMSYICDSVLEAFVNRMKAAMAEAERIRPSQPAIPDDPNDLEL